MIDVRRQLPDVYYDESRDFQLIGRLFEAVFNYLKTGVDNIENTMDAKDIDDRLVSLMASSVGFEGRHTYNAHNLKVVLGCFNDIVKDKGSKRAVDKAVAALLNSQGLDERHYVEVDYAKNDHTVNVYLPANTEDIILLKDMMDYILPVGWSYSVGTSVGGVAGYDTEAKVTDRFAFVNKRGELNPDKGTGYEDLNKVAKLSDETENKSPTSVGVVSSAEVQDAQEEEE